MFNKKHPRRTLSKQVEDFKDIKKILEDRRNMDTQRLAELALQNIPKY